MAADLAVRRLVPDDWAAYRMLRLEMLADAPDYFWSTLEMVQDRDEQAWRSEVAGPRTHYQAVRDGEVVGALSIDWVGYTAEHPLAEGSVNIVSVFVRPAHRGTGVTAALLAAADQAMRERGRTRQLLETPEDNTPARRTYERLGFTETGRRFPDPRRAGLEEVEYERILPA
ncbi:MULTISPECIES: GNAT family N-acetyltransferase [unclassified Brachybacterium]|uniref:GNAT family N-acetyltransferase n=1 Tax=unclassified Brachybacterium TaxID=2623841 RepID=UPI000C80410A|nr:MULTISPECIES: GNAT family N-acetyltransferase [unclassified Brachybacterium]PMC75774.1 GNAT family N-acetyltransferase [Brachybacterium sp. UMB0905]